VSEGPADGDAEADDAGAGSADDGASDGETGDDAPSGGVGGGDDGESDAAADDEGSDAGSGPSGNWRGTLAEVGALTPEAVSAIADAHGDRGLQAIEAVSEGRVKQYRDFTVVVGHTDEYVVEDGGCTCKDSAYNLDRENPDARCWHALAVDVAEALGEVDHHDMWYSEVREFL
jgi:predicted nucleic acid-binding Zn finger protein